MMSMQIISEDALSTWPDWLRALNLVLSLVVTVRLLRFYKHCGKEMSKSERDMWVIWLVIALAVVVAATDGIVRHVSVTPRVLITTVIVLAQIQGIYLRKLWTWEHTDDTHVHRAP